MKKLLLSTFLLTFFSFSGIAQGLTVSGQVTGDDNETLPGVNVVIEGTSQGTVTDFDGNYTMTVSDPNANLIFSFVGFETQTVAINGRSLINVSLALNVEQLEEVVVIGYGTVRKSDLTGSVSSIRGDDLIKVPSSNPLQALQGKVAGINVATGSGEPGENPVVRVRGVGTLNNANPIFVVDGVILDDVSFLNANDIESMDVLKDASATAIYGSRGANGVFIITTKGSRVGQVRPAQISFKAEYSIQRLQNKIDLMNKEEFVDAYNEIFPGTFNNTDVLPDIDWQDEIFVENPTIQSYDLSVNGGTENFSYYLGGGLFKQEGIIPKSNFERYTLKANTSFKPTSYLTVGSNLSGAFFDDDAAPGVIFAAYGAWPIDDPFNDDGSFAEVRGTSNPLATIDFTNNNTRRYRLVANNYAEIAFLKNFRIKTSYQTDFLYSKGTSYTPEFFVSSVQQNPDERLTVSFGESRTWIWENTLSYSNVINNDHRIDAFVGLTYQETFNEFPEFSFENLVASDPDFWFLNAKDGATDSVNVNDYNPDRLSIQSYIGRVNYSYKDRYLATATFRSDGSSKFREEDRWGLFPSFAVGWNLHNESFFPASSVLETAKLRASWGIIGNEKIGSRNRFSTINSGAGAVFGPDDTLFPGATFGTPGNPLLLWENTIQTNIGTELSFLDGRITTEIDYYYKKTEDILVNLSAPGHLGYGSFVQVRFNAATVINKGVELNLTGREEIGDFGFEINVNATTINNEVESLGASIPSENFISGGSILGSQVTRTQPGEPIGSFFGYEVIGVYQNQDQLDQFPSLNGTEVGDLIYRDVNNDNRINAEDRVAIGSAVPDFTYGIAINTSYKALSLGLDFQGVSGNDIYNAKNQTRVSFMNFEDRVNDRYTPANPSNSEPRLTTTGGSLPPSTYYIEDGSFFRLRTVTLSYDLPKDIASKLELNSLLVYLRGTNVFTITDYSGYSPEVGSSDPLSPGIDRGIYPITSVYSLGMNLTF